MNWKIWATSKRELDSYFPEMYNIKYDVQSVLINLISFIF